jgi:hypothetical protein
MKTKFDSKIDDLATEIRELNRQLHILQEARSDLISRETIKSESIVLADIQESSGDELPWFGDLWTFANWMRQTNCQKRFAEWNGLLYKTSDLFAGSMKNTGARIDHVPAEATA